MGREDREIERLAIAQEGAFARRQAIDVGFSHDMMRYRLERGAWTRTRFDDVYRLAPRPPTWRQELWAGALWAGVDALVAARSAAALYLLDRCPEGPIDLLLPLHAKHVAPRGVRVTRSNLAGPPRNIDGLAVTDPETTLLGVARRVRADVLDDILESAFDLGLTTPGKLLLAIGRRPGSGPIRRILEGRQPGRPRQSVLEGELSRLAAVAGLELVRQFEIRVEGDRFFFDFAIPGLRIAIEVDGFGKLRTKAGKQKFLERSTKLALLGWTILHFSWDDVMNRPEYVLATIMRAVG